MIQKFFFMAAFTCLGSTVLLAEPTPAPKSNTSRKNAAAKPQVTPATPLVSGWSYANGVWTHVNGYKFANGQVMRMGIQTHKKAPPPPSKAELDSVVNKKVAPKPPVDSAAAKAAERQRNLAPRPAAQTGSHF